MNKKFNRNLCRRLRKKKAHRALLSTNVLYRLIKSTIGIYRRANFVKRNRTKIAGVLATLISGAFTEALNGNIAAMAFTVLLVILLVVTWT